MICRFMIAGLISIFTYTGLFAFFFLFQNIFTAKGYIGPKLNLLAFIYPKAQEIIAQLQNQNLALNFLLNQRILTTEEKIAFQSSGLIHLLAVSGGQIVPVCRVVCGVFQNILYFCCHKIFKPALFMQINYYIRCVFIIFIAFLMTGLFDCAGALARVSFFFACNEFLKTFRIFYSVAKYFPYVSSHFIRRFFLLCLMSFSFGNVFFDYSFLLSSIGALSVEILARCFYNSFNRLKISPILKNSLFSIFLTISASWLISFILYPVCKTPIFLSAFANVCAAPIVTFILTPISLCLIFIPFYSQFTQYLIKIFDYFLSVLNNIAVFFQESSYSIQIPKTLLFSFEGQAYLVIILMMLLCVSDLIYFKSERFE